MLDLPRPRLGDVSAITMASPDLEGSLQYYQRLGFSEVGRSDFPFPWIQICDGALLIMLRLDRDRYCGLTYYVKALDATVAELQRLGVVFLQKPQDGEIIKRYLTQSPDGLNLSLVTFVEGFRQPPGPTMLMMPQQDLLNPEKYVNKVCGLFAEFAHPVKDLARSLAFWQRLGFATLSKSASPYPWAIISDGLSILGLHQTEEFSYPAITFFAPDMKSRVGKLKAEVLGDYSEKDGGRNIVLTTPEKQHINLFTLGM